MMCFLKKPASRGVHVRREDIGSFQDLSCQDRIPQKAKVPMENRIRAYRCVSAQSEALLECSPGLAHNTGLGCKDRHPCRSWHPQPRHNPSRVRFDRELDLPPAPSNGLLSKYPFDIYDRLFVVPIHRRIQPFLEELAA